MKIAYLSSFYPLRGGIAQFNASLYRFFEKEHEIKAFTFKRQYPEFLFPGETQYVTEKDKADKIDSIPLLDSINPFSYFSTAKAINRFGPDLLIMKYWMSFFGPSLGTVARLMKPHTKVITILDNVIPHEKRIIDEPFTKYFLKQNDGFVAMSDSVKRDLLSFLPQAPVIKLDHPLYDHFGEKLPVKAAREQLKLDPDKKTILFFGFIRKYKGLDLLIKAFDLLDERYQLIIAGESYESFDEYQRLVDAAKLKKNIHVFNQYIGDDEVPAFFSAADVCILPYKSATQSGITSIAIHFDLPLIATDTGGLKEIIHHEKTGLIVSEISAEAIAAAIHTYFDQEKRAAFTAQIKTMKKELSWEYFGRRLMEFSKNL